VVNREVKSFIKHKALAKGVFVLLPIAVSRAKSSMHVPLLAELYVGNALCVC
jgi:hypothetical protein